MNARLVVALALTMIVASCMAFGDTYGYEFAYGWNDGHMSFESDAGASRGYDSHDIKTLASNASLTYLVFRKQRGVDGWDADDCFLARDARPVLDAGQTEVFNGLYLWAGTNATPEDFELYIVVGGLYSPQMTYTLRLVQIPTGITYTGPTEWGPNHGTISLPFFATDDFSKGYKFQVEITAPVPEPSSVLPLAVGITGLGGLVLRRRTA